jgi:hypothetical protein
VGGNQGGPPPLPGNGGGGINQANAGAANAGQGAPGGGVAHCTWEIFVKVHSQHKFWPKEGFNVDLHALAGGKLGAQEQSRAAAMNAKVLDPPAHFQGSGKKTFGVTCTAPKIANEADWVLVTGPKAKTKLPNDLVKVEVRDGQLKEKARKVDLHIRHPLLVYAQLKLKDPEDRELTFPKNYPVRVYSGTTKADKEVASAKLDADGKFDFELDRKYEWFTFKFGRDKGFISNGDGTTTATEWKSWSDRQKLEKAGAKFFSPPASWMLAESYWKFSEEPKYIDGAAAYKEDEGKIYVYDDPTKNWVRRIGEKGAHVSLLLDPKWQFLRHEFFDRYYGHTDHNHERANTPPFLVEGFWGTGNKLDREGSAHWTLSPESVTDSVHCLPWIRQKEATGAKAEKPDKNALIQFKLPANTFVYAQDANTRKLIQVGSNDAKMKANVDRLKLYDLPKEWKSKGYWARYLTGPNTYDGKFWEDWDPAGYLKSRSKATPMIFSLDDVVLTDAAFVPLALKKTDQFAIFYHRFAKAYNEAANLTEEGVYMPDPGEPFYSKVERKGADFNYITEYPNWVRLVAGQSSCFDAFDKRTSKKVFGARAGVRWYNAIASAKPAGTAVNGWPKDIAKKYFALGPEWGQKHALTNHPFKGANTPTQRIGRFDMVLLRCCDRLAGDKEFFLNMQYFRLNYNFLAAKPAGSSPGAAGSAHAGTPGTGYIRSGISALIKRWNGYDGASNNKRAELIPQDPAGKQQGEVIYFLHPAPALKGAHFRMDVFNGTAADRAFMNSTDGIGQITDADFAPDATFAPDSFTLAHELGHGASLPDEYGEWWTRCNHNGPGVTNNIPADPFVDEGRDFDLTASLYPGATPYPMMTMAVEMRNRYFWHNAEFSRKHIGVPLLSKHDAFDQYKVPGHPRYPTQTYTYWPVRQKMNRTGGKHGKVDIYLHALGKERFTQTLMKNGPWDGMLSVLIKIDIDIPATVSVGDVRDIVRNAILTFNQTFSAEGTTKVPTDKGDKNLALTKVVFRFSPRFLIKNVNPAQTDFSFGGGSYANDYAGWGGWIGTHFKANVLDNAGVVPPLASGFVNPTGGAMKLVLDSTKAWKPALTADVQALLPKMLGIALGGPVIAAGDLTPLAKTVIDKNAKVL